MLGAVQAALARVLERDPASIEAATSLADLGADSLVRVEVAELVEQALEQAVRISDAELDAASTVAGLAASFATSSTTSRLTSTGGDV